MGYDVRQTGDGGYIAVGHTLSSGAGLHDVFLVRLDPENAPLFGVSPDSLIFSGIAPGDTLTDSLRVSNSGTADLIIHSVTATQPFISVSPAAATIAPDSSAIFRVQLIAGSLPGSLQGNVEFQHNGQSSPDSVLVHAEVLTAVSTPEAELPQTFALLPNYPNPFNPATTSRFYLPRRSSITLEIYNSLGQKVRTLLTGDSPAGLQSVAWNGRDDNGRAVASGIYFYRLSSEGLSLSRRLLLLR